jgi:hypothetical protein
MEVLDDLLTMRLSLTAAACPVFAATLADLASMSHAFITCTQQQLAPEVQISELPMICNAAAAFHQYAQRNALAVVQAAEADVPARRAPPPLPEADFSRVQVGPLASFVFTGFGANHVFVPGREGAKCCHAFVCVCCQAGLATWVALVV